LAEGRSINASATCGEDYFGKDGEHRELYCKLVGANWYDNVNKHIFQGQACDYCDPNDPALSHKADFAIDGTERWWQSPPLSRGVRFNEVNLTIDLGQVREIFTCCSSVCFSKILYPINFISLMNCEEKNRLFSS
jgi:laminin alpha 3/5